MTEEADGCWDDISPPFRPSALQQVPQRASDLGQGLDQSAVAHPAGRNPTEAPSSELSAVIFDLLHVRNHPSSRLEGRARKAVQEMPQCTDLCARVRRIFFTAAALVPNDVEAIARLRACANMQGGQSGVSDDVELQARVAAALANSGVQVQGDELDDAVGYVTEMLEQMGGDNRDRRNVSSHASSPLHGSKCTNAQVRCWTASGIVTVCAASQSAFDSRVWVRVVRLCFSVSSDCRKRSQRRRAMTSRGQTSTQGSPARLLSPQSPASRSCAPVKQPCTRSCSSAAMSTSPRSLKPALLKRLCLHVRDRLSRPHHQSNRRSLVPRIAQMRSSSWPRTLMRNRTRTTAPPTLHLLSKPCSRCSSSSAAVELQALTRDTRCSCSLRKTSARWLRRQQWQLRRR